MSYKVCNRCLFIVPKRNKLCTTCGCNAFSAIQDGKVSVMPQKPQEEQPVTSVSSVSIVEVPPALPDRALRNTGPHALRRKFYEYESTRHRSENIFGWQTRR